MTSRVSLATYYNAVLGPRGFNLAPHHYPMVHGIEDDRIPFLAVIGPPGLGKSTLWSIAAPTWMIGNDPTMTVLGISAGEKLVGTFLHAAMDVVQRSPHYAELFPNVRPDMAAGWSSERGMYVTGRPVGDQDASYFVAGLKSKALTGVHARRILIDDIHDEGNSATPEMRADVKATYYRTLLGRADPRGCRFIAAGRRWAVDDIYGEWIRSGEWVVLHMPAIREVSQLRADGTHGTCGSPRLWIDVYVPRGLTCVYTETLQQAPPKDQNSKAAYVRYRAYYGIDPTGQGFYWPDSQAKRREVLMQRRGSPLTFETVYQGNPEAGEDQVFQESDFRPYLPPANLSLGVASPDVAALIKITKGHVAQAWDTAMGQNTSTAVTAGITGLIVPCSEWHCGEDPAIHGKCEFHFDVWLLDLFAKNVPFDEMVREVRRLHRMWDARRVIVEQKVSGVSLLQTLQASDVPLYPVKVHEGKVERAVNGVGGGAASVQGWCKLGRVHYPAGAPWAAQWLERVTRFTGDASARADEFDATVHLVTYAILRSRQTGRMATEIADSSVLPAAVDSATATVAAKSGLRGLIAELSTASNAGPFGEAGLCGSPCQHWSLVAGRRRCALDGTPRMALETCGKFLQAPA